MKIFLQVFLFSILILISFFFYKQYFIKEEIIEKVKIEKEINTDNIKINLITKDVQFYMNSQNEKIKITSN